MPARSPSCPFEVRLGPGVAPPEVARVRDDDRALRRGSSGSTTLHSHVPDLSSMVGRLRVCPPALPTVLASLHRGPYTAPCVPRGRGAGRMVPRRSLHQPETSVPVDTAV